MSCRIVLFFNVKVSFTKCKPVNIMNVFICERKVIYGIYTHTLDIIY